MFAKSSRYYDIIYDFKDYAGEVSKLAGIISQHFGKPAQTLLDVACGTGRHLEHFKPWLMVEGVDINEDLLRQARERLPDTPFHQGDMRSFDLNRQFDCVTCLFSSIGNMPDVDSLNRAIATMSRHVRPGGLLIVEPWWPPDNWIVDGKPRAQCVERGDVKIVRMSLSGREGNVSTIDFHYLLGSPEGFETFSEQHRYTLFSIEEQLAAFRDAGLQVGHSSPGLTGRGLLIGSKP